MVMGRRAFGAAMGGLAVGAAGEAAGEAGTMARVRQRGALRFGVVAGQPPYCWKDVATGAWRGFVVDLCRAFAASIGVEAEPVEAGWGTAVLEVQAGRIDVFFGLAPTPARAQAVDFTHALYQNALALIARPGFDPARWAALDDPAVRIALETGTQYDQAVPHLCPRATVTRLRTNTEATMALQSGRVDCQILVVVLALTVLARNPALGHLVVPEPVYGATTNGIVAKEADGTWLRTLDTFIDRRRADGEVRRMLLANLVLSGVAPGAVPGQLLF